LCEFTAGGSFAAPGRTIRNVQARLTARDRIRSARIVPPLSGRRQPTEISSPLPRLRARTSSRGSSADGFALALRPTDNSHSCSRAWNAPVSHWFEGDSHEQFFHPATHEP